MKATVLTDNIGNAKTPGEWGLSFYIEYGGKNYLLDAGASGLFAANAAELGLSLQKVDAAVLSHAHYDHADGMSRFFEENDRAELYLRDCCGENCYKKEGPLWKYIGIQKGLLEKYKDRLVYVSGIKELAKGVWLLPHSTKGLDKIGKMEHMFLKGREGWETDTFRHEQSLVFNAGDGLVIFNSCCHGGADNIIREVSDVFEGKKIRAVIGGFHLHNKSEEYVRAFACRIRKTGAENIYTGHCTGEEAFRILREELGNMVRQLRVGLVMEFSSP